MFKWFKPITDVQIDRLLGLLDWTAFLIVAAVFIIGGFYLIIF